MAQRFSFSRSLLSAGAQFSPENHGMMTVQLFRDPLSVCWVQVWTTCLKKEWTNVERCCWTSLSPLDRRARHHSSGKLECNREAQSFQQAQKTDGCISSTGDNRGDDGYFSSHDQVTPVRPFHFGSVHCVTSAWCDRRLWRTVKRKSC